ncbi:discoidin domain-containing protein [Patescibacteria group bacterium]
MTKILSSIFILLITITIFHTPIVAQESTLITNILTQASDEYEEKTSDKAVDGDNTTNWNSGGFAPQWIVLDLGSQYTINKIELNLRQSPNGRTVHKIEIGPTINNLKELITLDQITHNDQVITIPLLKTEPNVRFVKINSLMSPSWITWNEIKIYQGQTAINNHLKYFGYMSTDGIGVEVSPTYYSELANLSNTNVAWSYIANLEEFSKLNIKGLMAEVRWLFFQDGELHPDWQTKWENYAQRLQGHEEDIYGFYFDEPVWNGYSKSAFLTATRTIHETFPNKAIFIIEASPPISNNTIPEGYYEYVSDIGFDYYFTLHSNSNDEGWGMFLDNLEKYKPYVQGKKFWVIPDGYSNNSGVIPRWPNAFERYLSLVLTTENGVGIMPFIYNADDFLFTLRDVLDPTGKVYNPSFRTRNIEVGRLITQHSSHTPTPTQAISSPTPTTATSFPPGDANEDSLVNGADYIIWLNHYSQSTTNKHLDGDFNKSGIVDGADYIVWVTNYDG